MVVVVAVTAVTAVAAVKKGLDQEQGEAWLNIWTEGPRSCGIGSRKSGVWSVQCNYSVQCAVCSAVHTLAACSQAMYRLQTSVYVNSLHSIVISN
jgi:hypothetical protein